MDGMVVKAFVTMLMIVGLMFGLLVVVRKYVFAKPRITDENMKVLSTISLQPKKAIYLVKIFDKVMLVGVSDNAMAALGEITDGDALQQLESAMQKKSLKGFSDILKGFMPK